MARPQHRHVVRILVLLLIGLAVSRLLKQLKGTTAQRRDPDHGPVIGSVDTWAAVPRAPHKVAGAGS
jgi:hypothetical protein